VFTELLLRTLVTLLATLFLLGLVVLGLGFLTGDPEDRLAAVLYLLLLGVVGLTIFYVLLTL